MVAVQAGGVSEHMHSNLMAGELVRVAVGGDFTLTDRMGAPPGPDSKVLLLSAGIGVTPMIGALRWLRQREAKRCSDPNRCRCSFYVMPKMGTIYQYAVGGRNGFQMIPSWVSKLGMVRYGRDHGSTSIMR